MSPEEHLRSGDLDAALAALQDQIRSNASDPKLRIFLFQLLCVTGNWKRAITQLKVCGELDPLALPMCQAYREAIVCEVFREKVFAGEKDPMVFGEPAEWLARLIEAAKLNAQGKPAEAARLRDLAFEAAPTSSGTIDGQPFEWIADADMRFGPVIEAVVNGRYFWVPFSAVRKIEIEAPADLRDVVWTPASMTVASGGTVIALLPTRYPGTVASGDAAQKLARATDWTDIGAETFAGLGQRLWTTDAGDRPLMEVRELVINGGQDG